MAKNPDFDAVLTEMESVHDRKNEDYAADSNPYSNFEGVARITGLPTNKVFQVMIGIKIERLRQLVETGKEANFESVDDTILDLANYAAIWLAWRRRQAFDFGPGQTLSDLGQRIITKREFMESMPPPTARTRATDALDGQTGPY